MPKGIKIRSTMNIGAASDAMRKGAAEGLTLATEYLLTEANKRVPHDEGTLERSGEASVDGEALRGAVSYDTPYAARQHEDMTATHPGKGEPKWLENTMREEASTVRDIISASIAKAVAEDAESDHDEQTTEEPDADAKSDDDSKSGPPSSPADAAPEAAE